MFVIPPNDMPTAQSLLNGGCSSYRFTRQHAFYAGKKSSGGREYGLITTCDVGLSQAHGRENRALEDFMPAKGTVKIEVERCKACGFCVEFCPSHVLALSSAFNSKGYHPPHVVDAEKCSGCDLCGMYCPDFAITGAKLKPKAEVPKTGDTAK